MSAWYMLNNASFENSYCINIDLPDKMCHGSCAIEELSEPSNPEQIPINIKLSKWVEFLIPKVVFDSDEFFEKLIFLPNFEDISFFYKSPYLDGLLHPPC